MPTVNEMFPKPHLTAEDLQGNSVNITIKDVVQKEVNDPNNPGTTKFVWALEFPTTKKYFILNKTNSDSIADIMESTKTADWIGNKVVLYPVEIEAFGKKQDVIRVSDSPDKKTVEEEDFAPEPPPENDDAPPF